jgi:thiol-disulfide isomerase/thioredoxin
MTMQRLTSSIVLLTLLTFTVAASEAPVPRKSTDFTISEPSGKKVLLSSFKGKVVVIEFLFIRSQHCMRVAQTLNKLHAELGTRGFQPVGVVFDPPDSGAYDPNTGAQLVTYMVDYFKITYPVGYAAKTDVDAYLGRTGTEVLNIPQVVVIDRAGMIRAQSGRRPGDPKLENEDSLRSLVNSLLKENPATESPVKSHPASATKIRL